MSQACAEIRTKSGMGTDIFDHRFWTEGNASLFQLASSQRLPQTRLLELMSCDKSGTFPDSWLQELHGDFGMLYLLRRFVLDA